MDTGIAIRPAAPADVELIYSLIKELAEYERAPEKVTGTSEQLAEALFGPDQPDDAGAAQSGEAGCRARGVPVAEALIAEVGGEPAGFALFHGSFSTWECRPGLWLEDLYVPPRHRRSGVGGALLARVAEIAVQRGCARLEWAALDWNTPALDFYAKLGAEPLGDWVMHRLDGDALERVASGSRASRE